MPQLFATLVCPWCAVRHDLTIEAETGHADAGQMPQDGDLSLCARCHRLAVFTAGGTALRRPTEAEALTLAAEQAAALAVPRGDLTPAAILAHHRDVARFGRRKS